MLLQQDGSAPCLADLGAHQGHGLWEKIMTSPLDGSSENRPCPGSDCSAVLFVACFPTLEVYRSWMESSMATLILSAILIVLFSPCLACLVAEPNQKIRDVQRADWRNETSWVFHRISASLLASLLSHYAYLIYLINSFSFFLIVIQYKWL